MVLYSGGSINRESPVPCVLSFSFFQIIFVVFFDLILHRYKSTFYFLLCDGPFTLLAQKVKTDPLTSTNSVIYFYQFPIFNNFCKKKHQTVANSYFIPFSYKSPILEHISPWGEMSVAASVYAHPTMSSKRSVLHLDIGLWRPSSFGSCVAVILADRSNTRLPTQKQSELHVGTCYHYHQVWCFYSQVGFTIRHKLTARVTA